MCGDPACVYIREAYGLAVSRTTRFQVVQRGEPKSSPVHTHS